MLRILIWKKIFSALSVSSCFFLLLFSGMLILILCPACQLHFLQTYLIVSGILLLVIRLLLDWRFLHRYNSCYVVKTLESHFPELKNQFSSAMDFSGYNLTNRHNNIFLRSSNVTDVSPSAMEALVIVRISRWLDGHSFRVLNSIVLRTVFPFKKHIIFFFATSLLFTLSISSHVGYQCFVKLFTQSSRPVHDTVHHVFPEKKMIPDNVQNNIFDAASQDSDVESPFFQKSPVDKQPVKTSEILSLFCNEWKQLLEMEQNQWTGYQRLQQENQPISNEVIHNWASGQKECHRLWLSQDSTIFTSGEILNQTDFSPPSLHSLFQHMLNHYFIIQADFSQRNLPVWQQYFNEQERTGDNTLFLNNENLRYLLKDELSNIELLCNDFSIFYKISLLYDEYRQLIQDENGILADMLDLMEKEAGHSLIHKSDGLSSQYLKNQVHQVSQKELNLLNQFFLWYESVRQFDLNEISGLSSDSQSKLLEIRQRLFTANGFENTFSTFDEKIAKITQLGNEITDCLDKYHFGKSIAKTEQLIIWLKQPGLSAEQTSDLSITPLFTVENTGETSTKSLPDMNSAKSGSPHMTNVKNISRSSDDTELEQFPDKRNTVPPDDLTPLKNEFHRVGTTPHQNEPDHLSSGNEGVIYHGGTQTETSSLPIQNNPGIISTKVPEFMKQKNFDAQGIQPLPEYKTIIQLYHQRLLREFQNEPKN